MLGWLFAGRKRQKTPQLDREAALTAVPVRNPHVEFEEAGDALVLSYPLAPSRSLRLLAWFMKRFSGDAPPPRRKVELDTVGSRVWRLCDGKHQVREIAEDIAREYRLPEHEAEHSTVLFLRTLASRGLIGIVVQGGAEAAGAGQTSTQTGG